MNTIEEKVSRARKDRGAMDRLIRDNKRFIMAKAYRACGRFLTESDDEWQVACIAFCEAAEKYRPEKGDFYAYAGVVIKHRLFDYARGELRRTEPIRMSMDETGSAGSSDEKEAAGPPQEVLREEARLSRESGYAPIPGNTPVKDEIEALGQVLAGYGFRFMDLSEGSPHAAKTKAACAKAVLAILGDEALMSAMRKTKKLPVQELKKRGFKRKVLERHRKYIIAAAEILAGDYPHLAEYMRYIKEMKDEGSAEERKGTDDERHHSGN